MANEFLFGVAMGNGIRARASSAAAESLANTANFTIGKLEEAGNYIATLKDRVATLESQARIDDASIAGMKAQIAAFKAQHPASPLLANSGKAFKDGEAKSKLRLIYEQNFDALLRKVGIVSPGSFRED